MVKVAKDVRVRHCRGNVFANFLQKGNILPRSPRKPMVLKPGDYDFREKRGVIRP